MNKKSGVQEAAKEHMTTSHVLGPDESLPGTVSYDVPIDPDLLKLSPAAQDEVEVLLKQLLAIVRISGKRKEFNSKAMLVKHTATGQCCISRCLSMLMKSPYHAEFASLSPCNGTAQPQPVRQWHATTPEVPFVASLLRKPLWSAETDSEDNLALSVMTELQFAMELVKRGPLP